MHAFSANVALIILISTGLQAYEVLSSKTEVSPGCEGGIISHTCISRTIPHELEETETQEESSAEIEDVQEEK